MWKTKHKKKTRKLFGGMTSIRGTKIISVSRQMVSYNPLPCVQTSVCSLNGGGGRRDVLIKQGEKCSYRGTHPQKKFFSVPHAEKIVYFFQIFVQKCPKWHMAFFGRLWVAKYSSPLLRCAKMLATPPKRCPPPWEVSPDSNYTDKRQVPTKTGQW